jgi:hypothetical protein
MIARAAVLAVRSLRRCPAICSLLNRKQVALEPGTRGELEEVEEIPPAVACRGEGRL